MLFRLISGYRHLARLAALVGSASVMVAACSGAAHSELLDGTPDAGTGGDGSSSHSASRDARHDSNDSASSDPGIRCASVYCTVGTQSCCRVGSATPYDDSCVPTGHCDGDGATALQIPCDDTADCTAGGRPGDVCCVEANQNSIATSVTCRPPGDCKVSQGRAPLCDPSDPNACPPSTPRCLPSSQTLVGYLICQP
jgi:hypothetical protein